MEQQLKEVKEASWKTAKNTEVLSVARVLLSVV